MKTYLCDSCGCLEKLALAPDCCSLCGANYPAPEAYEFVDMDDEPEPTALQLAIADELELTAQFTSAEQVRTWAHDRACEFTYPDHADYVAECAVQRWKDHQRTIAVKSPWLALVAAMQSVSLNQQQEF